MPPNVNRRNTDNFLPVITPDGKTLYYFTNFTNFGDVEVRKVERSGNRWSNPKDVDPKIFNPSLNHKGSIFFSYMTDEVYFSTRKSPIIGGFDIKVSNGSAGNIGQPVNIGKPVNSRLHEGAPSLTPDGNTMYFMRCTSMDADSESGCKILSASRKPSGLWEEPVELPDNINNGDSRFPTILPDGETLIFSSNRVGSVGGFDLYMSRRDGNAWTEPKPLNFLNTSKDEMRVTAPLPGDNIYYSIQEENDRQLYFTMLPDDFKAKPVRMYKGHVFDRSNNPLDAIVQAIDVNSGKTIVRTVSDSKGSFQILLPSGYEYDFSIFSKDGSHLYYAEFLDMLHEDRAERKFIDVQLDRLEDMSIMRMPDIVLEEDSATVSDKSNVALNRLSYFLNQNPEINIEIGVFMNNYIEDSVRSSFLSEKDTILESVTTVVEVIDSVMSSESLTKVDSLLQVANDERPLDTDSLRRTVLSYKTVVGYDTVTNEVERVIYHNDRTPLVAESLNEELLSRGISATRVSAFGLREELWNDLDPPDYRGIFIAVRFKKGY